MTPAFLAVAIISGIFLPLLLFLTNRLLARLERIDAHLARHSKALARLSSSQKLQANTNTKILDEIEELTDATDQLQLATSVLQDRSHAHDRFITAMQDERERRLTNESH